MIDHRPLLVTRAVHGGTYYIADAVNVMGRLRYTHSKYIVYHQTVKFVLGAL